MRNARSGAVPKRSAAEKGWFEDDDPTPLPPLLTIDLTAPDDAPSARSILATALALALALALGTATAEEGRRKKGEGRREKREGRKKKGEGRRQVVRVVRGIREG